MPSTGFYVCWFEPEGSQLRDIITWYGDAELARRVCAVLEREFGDRDSVKFKVIEPNTLGQADQWVLADKLIDELRLAVEAREEDTYDNTPVVPNDFSPKQPERYFVAARDTARRIAADDARAAPPTLKSKSPISIDESGTLVVNKAVGLDELLAILRDKISLFLVRLSAGQQAPNGDYILSDQKAGSLPGTLVLWEDAVLIMHVCIAHLLPPPDLSALAHSPTGVIVQQVRVPRNAQPLGDLLRQLTFSILYDAGGKPPSVIPQSTVKKIRQLTDELEYHRAALVGDPGPALPDPAGESLSAKQLAGLIREFIGSLRSNADGEKSDGSGVPPAKYPLPALRENDQEAWFTHNVLKQTQQATAEILKRRYPDQSWSQPRVHDAVKRVTQWIEAGMTAEQIEAAIGGAPARTLDPGVADMGQRRDGRAAHLRAKAQEIADSD